MNACKTGDKYKEGVACQTKFTTAKANSPLPMTKQILPGAPASERPTMSCNLPRRRPAGPGPVMTKLSCLSPPKLGAWPAQGLSHRCGATSLDINFIATIIFALTSAEREHARW